MQNGTTGELTISDDAAQLRSNALKSYKILGTAAEREFDDLVKLAGQICGTPVSLISLLAADEQWFKAKVGFAADSTPLSSSFCIHAVGEGDFMEIQDAEQDARFADNPLVVGPEQVRFYAGAVLRDEQGVALGTLCVLDTAPRSLTEEQKFGLHTLSHQVMALLKARREVNTQRQLEERQRLILDSALDYAIVSLLPDGTIETWSKGAEEIIGWTEEEAVGKHASVFFTDDDVSKDVPESEMTGADVNGGAVDERWHERKDGSKFWAFGRMMPLRDPDDEVTGYVKIMRDRTNERLLNERLRFGEQRIAMALRGATSVGTWDHDLEQDIVVGDEKLAEFYGLDPTKLERGVKGWELIDQTHPDDRETLEADLAAITEGDGEFESEFRIINEEGRIVWTHAYGSLLKDDDGKSVSFSGAIFDVSERYETEMRQRALIELGDRVRDLSSANEIAEVSAELLAQASDASRAGYGEMSDDGTWVTVDSDWAAPGVNNIVGAFKLDSFGLDFANSLRDGEFIVVNDVLEDKRTLENREAWQAINVRSLLNVPIMVGGKLRAIYFINQIKPRRWSKAEQDFVKSMFDRTYAAIQQVREEEQRKVLTEELAHRMKNMMAIIQSITAQSLRNADNLESAGKALGDRLRAFNDAQSILTQTDWQSANIKAIIKTALEPHDAVRDRVELSGPDVMLPPQQLLGLSLALHELITNAVKYGSLSNDTGLVTMKWERAGASEITLEWRESGGPEVTEPKRKGFGSTILSQITGSYFSGSGDLEYASDGLVYKLHGSVQHQL